MRRALLFGVGVLVLAVASLALAARDLDTPRNLHEVEHATSRPCGRCHEDHVASHARTFHRTMTQEASSAGAVLAPFAGESMSYFGVTARFDRDARDRPRVTFEGPGGRDRHSAIIERTVGSRRYQQYLTREGSTYVRLPIAWHVEEQRWIHMNGAFLVADPEEPPAGGAIEADDYARHATRWNDNCIFCHNVAPDPGLRPDGTFESQVAELGVACEACHGPGDDHVVSNVNPARRYWLHVEAGRDPSIVNPSRLAPERSAEICGRCHGQRITSDVSAFLRDGDPFVPGEELAQYSRPLARDTTLDGQRVFEARFWPDGTARLTAYEYQGLLQSECVRGGLTCTTCHGMHEGDPRGQIRPAMRGDAMCTQCHEETQGEAHVAHRATACVDCHMPKIVFGLVDVHRSHHIEVPQVHEDRPDACTLCHVSRDRTWARTFGRESDTSVPEVHRLALAGDPIERAIAAYAIGHGRARDDDADDRGVLIEVIRGDRYAAVRRIAARSLARITPTADVTALVPESTPSERAAWLAHTHIEASSPAPSLVSTLRAHADERAIAIGE